jgi:hypothetical protein
MEHVMRRYLIGLGVLATLTCTTALAQDLAAIEKAEEAVVAAWNATPILFRTSVFVSESPGGFGIYRQRESNVFGPGEPLVVYAEPVGYGWKDNGDGTFGFGFNVDLIIKKPDGSIVGGQENFQRLALSSRARNREFMLTLTLTFDGAPAGDYVLEYVVRDLTGSKSGNISLPFTVSN